ncbi:MAG: hypothetical protein FWB96_01215 [Defluviitaleaceae bacterium]|nr:hypothetical protein [Defluviitaleaceae bacterium]MCL2261688.1 hypothetical protein [Defluviitaleaceae bacterium]
MDYQNVSVKNVVTDGKLIKPGENATLEKSSAIEMLVKKGTLKQLSNPKK